MVYETLYEATHTSLSTIIVGNLSFFPQLLEFHLRNWLVGTPYETLFTSRVDGLSTSLIIEPMPGSVIYHRSIVITSHLDLQYDASKTRIVHLNEPLSKFPGVKNYPGSNVHLLHLLKMRYETVNCYDKLDRIHRKTLGCKP